uniref:(northern house mosquito) hypothetical protein n=1 Tax=Culex pipiens TaxID=7175 RepID=A0A8D8INM7_CULPI
MLRCAAPAPTHMLQAYSRGLFWDSRSQRQAVLLHSPTNVDNTAAAVVVVALSVCTLKLRKRGEPERTLLLAKSARIIEEELAKTRACEFERVFQSASSRSSQKSSLAAATAKSWNIVK